MDGVTLAVAPGERRAIIGPNGAGKTTLFSLISGETRPTAGEISLFGRDVTRLAPHRRAALGMARTYQITNLFPRLSALDNCVLAAQAFPREAPPAPRDGALPGRSSGPAGCSSRRPSERRPRWCAISPTGSSVSSRSRSPSRASRGSCSSTSPPRGCRRPSRR